MSGRGIITAAHCVFLRNWNDFTVIRETGSGPVGSTQMSTRNQFGLPMVLDPGTLFEALLDNSGLTSPSSSFPSG
jgi:hypothetical protein